MKKTFILLTMLITAFTASWADKPEIAGITLPDAPTATLDLTTQEDFAMDANGWIVFSPKAESVNSKDYWTCNATNGNDRNWTIPSGSTAPFVGGSNKSVFALQQARVHALRFTGAEMASFFLQGNSAARAAHAAMYTYDGTTFTLIEDKTCYKTSTYNGAEVLFEGLSTSTVYVVYFYGDETSNSDLLEVALKKSVGAVDPVFSLTESTIGLDETSQIQVGSKGNLDGITLVNLASSDNTVATVDATGLITPLKAGTTNITFTSEAVENKYNAVTATVTLALTVTQPVVATPALPASGAFVDSKEIAITCDTEGASVKYSTDNGATWIDYTESFTITETTTLQAKAVKENFSDSEVATATYTKITLVDQTEVTSTSTWDWSKFGTNEIKLTDTTTPAKNDEVVLANAVAYGLCESIGTDFGDAQNLKVKGEYLVRDSKYFQGGYVYFTTTVPGIVTVEFSNTGNRTSEDDNRYLNINGENTDAKSLVSRETTTGSAFVPAGDVTIKGTLQKDNSDQYIRIYKIQFSTSVPMTITSAGWASFSSAAEVAIPEGVTAYIASKKGESTVTLTELSGTIPANTGVVLSGNAGTYEAAITQTGATLSETNYLLPWLTEGTPTEDVYYTLAVSEGNPVFKKSSGGTLAAGKAYLVLPTEANVVNVLFDGDATGIGNEALRMMNQLSAPTGKANEELRGGVYDLQGRLVSRGYEGTEVRGYENSLVEGEEGNLAPSHPRTLAPSIKKGIYVVDGRKVVVK